MAEPITVITCAGSQTIGAGELVPMNSHHCEYLDEPQFKIATSSKTWQYDAFLWKAAWLFENNRHLVSRRIPIGYDVLAQLEPDGTILILPPGTATPAFEPRDALSIPFTSEASAG